MHTVPFAMASSVSAEAEALDHRPVFFLIKPDGMLHEEDLLYRVNVQYPLIWQRTLRLNDSLIEAIYSRFVPAQVMPALKEYLQEDAVCWGMVYADIAGFLEFTGKEMDPHSCLEGTIRHDYGWGVGITVSGLSIVRNAIHRPKDPMQNTFLLDILLATR
jgi:hypothetical protein